MLHPVTINNNACGSLKCALSFNTVLAVCLMIHLKGKLSVMLEWKNIPTFENHVN